MENLSLVDKLTASGGGEPAGFLNDIVEQLWPNICVAGAKIIRDAVEPILASTLPGPLGNLRFVKLDLGHVPIAFSNVDVHKTPNEGIKLDMDLDWRGVCDIELDGSHVPKIGIEKVQLKGRLSILLAPLTNIIPLIGAAQIAFINPPTLTLDFTDAANIADSGLISSTIRKTILNIIAGLAVLPNRFLVKLDANNDYFKTYQPHHGVLRLTIEKATGIAGPKKSGAKRLLQKLVKDVPDCYVKVNIGAEEEWRTGVQNNRTEPAWNETHDFLVTDFEQIIALDVQDDDLVGDDDIGLAYTTIKDILLKGGSQELSLTHKGEVTPAQLTVHAKYFDFVTEAGSLSASTQDSGNQGGEICGLATILVASASGLDGKRDELNPSVKVSLGDGNPKTSFQTAVKTYSPGTDIFNPSFDQAFRVPLTADMVSNPSDFKISLMNKTTEVGSVLVPFRDVVGAQGMVKAGEFDVGAGATVKVSLAVHGMRHAR